ncbi:MAG: YlxM family DNA-binding protein [Acholeplasmataceae bacterium]|jgi:predicted DNA-binding protein YlxM (UPF0122 family)
MELIKLEKLNKLFAHYQNLLTDKQKDYFRMYYYDDYSLSEIAEIMNVSRNAVYDQLKRVESKLLEYEEKLKLEEKANLRLSYYQQYLKTKDTKYLNMLIEMDDEDE